MSEQLQLTKFTRPLDPSHEQRAREFAAWKRRVATPTDMLEVLGREPEILELFQAQPWLREVVNTPVTFRNFRKKAAADPTLTLRVQQARSPEEALRLLYDKQPEVKKTARLPTQVTTASFERPAQTVVDLKDLRIRSESQAMDWSEKLGSEESFARVYDYLVKEYSIRVPEFVRSGVMVRNYDRELKDDVSRIFLKKDSFVNEQGERVRYYYYQVPQHLVKTLCAVAAGSDAEQLPAVGEEADRVKQYFEKEYACEIPVVGIGVRSRQQKLDGSHDFGTTTFTGGWTADSFTLPQLKNREDPRSTSMMEDLFGAGDRGHNAVIVLPSLHFAGARNLRDAQGRWLGFDELKGKCESVYRLMLSVNDGKEDESLFYQLLYSSGTAAQFYEDELTIFGATSFIGHSRGGEVAKRINDKNHLRLTPIDCLALMPASCLPSDRRSVWIIIDDLASLMGQSAQVTMGERFSALSELNRAADWPIADLAPIEFIIDRWLTPFITERLIKDPFLASKNNRWLLDALVKSHVEVIDSVNPRAIYGVIGDLGLAERRPWPYAGPFYGKSFDVQGPADELSRQVSLDHYLKEELDSLTGKLWPWIPAGMEEEVAGQIRNDTLYSCEVKLPEQEKTVSGGHYAFMIQSFRRQYLNRWWDQLAAVRPTASSRKMAGQILTGMKADQLPLLAMAPHAVRKSFGHPVDQWMKDSSPLGKLIVCSPREFEQLRRSLVLESGKLQIMEEIENRMYTNLEHRTRREDQLRTLRATVERKLADVWWNSAETAKLPFGRLANLQAIVNAIEKNNIPLTDQTRDRLLLIGALELQADKLYREPVGPETGTLRIPSAIKVFLEGRLLYEKIASVTGKEHGDKEYSAIAGSWLRDFDDYVPRSYEIKSAATREMLTIFTGFPSDLSLPERLKIIMYRKLGDRYALDRGTFLAVASRLVAKTALREVTAQHIARQTGKPPTGAENGREAWQQLSDTVPQLQLLDEASRTDVHQPFIQMYRQTREQLLNAINTPA